MPTDSWKNRSIENAARDIYNILSKRKFLLLLDDMWESIDLTKVGVPLSSQKTESKIVFTTCFEEVCGKMEAQKKIKVECLGIEEAWRLFQMKVGEDTLDSHPDIPKLAKTMAKECAGLLLALISVGQATTCKKTPEEWRDAIEMLTISTAEFSGMDGVYRHLKFTYDRLFSDKIRSCFLYCCLFPEDYKIDKRNLIDYWIDEGFLDEYGESRAVNGGYTIIGDLIRACLLENEQGNCVTMHDVARDMALWIACQIQKEKQTFLVLAGAGLTEAPTVESCKVVRRISLRNNQIQNLSQSPICPQLQTLLLDFNNLLSISYHFLEHMPSLRVLDLSYNLFLTSLPSGVSKLVSLRHLNLSCTRIAELQNSCVL